MSPVTVDDLIAALLEAQQPMEGNPHGALTMSEILARTGLAGNKVLLRLRELKREGRLGVTKVAREALDGTLHPRPAYYLVRDSSESHNQGIAERQEITGKQE